MPNRGPPDGSPPRRSPPYRDPLDRCWRGHHGRDRPLRPVVSERLVHARSAGTALTVAHAAQPLGMAARQSPIALALVLATKCFTFGRIVAARGSVAHHSQFCRGEEL
jgi:hypothetical protein